MLKRLMVFLAALLILVPVPAPAETRTQANAETGFTAVLEDSAGLLDTAEKDAVMAEMMEITAFCNAGFLTYAGDSKEYVTSKAKNWGSGTFGSAEYTMFMIDMATRRIAVYSSDGILKTITTGKANTITDNVSRSATAGDYGECARSAFEQMLNVLRGEKIAEPMRYASNALLAIVAAILLAYLFISARMEQEVKVSMPGIITATAGAGAVLVGRKLMRKVRHQSHSSGGGGFGGGGGGGFSGGGGGGSHGF